MRRMDSRMTANQHMIGDKKGNGACIRGHEMTKARPCETLWQSFRLCGHAIHMPRIHHGAKVAQTNDPILAPLEARRPLTNTHMAKPPGRPMAL